MTDSKYLRKRKSGRMMYGPGCCGHEIKTTNCNKCGTLKEYGRDCPKCRPIVVRLVNAND